MTNLAYRIERSPKRKKLTITVERDRAVVVRAPAGATDGDIDRAVIAKRQWIKKKVQHPQKYNARTHPPGKEVVSGESAPYLGREYRIELSQTASDEVEFDQKFLVPSARQARRHQVLKKWYMARAKEKILDRVTHHARSLGVSVKAAKIVDSRYRWGSCTVNDNVNFNWRLIKAPMFVIDYVVVHELAHLLESNHTSRFWGIVRANTGSMEKAKRWLLEHGQMLEEEV
jgi:predicted metal-dependent hydrolase